MNEGQLALRHEGANILDFHCAVTIAFASGLVGCVTEFRERIQCAQRVDIGRPGIERDGHAQGFADLGPGYTGPVRGGGMRPDERPPRGRSSGFQASVQAKI
jgi:hypothetical protein